MPTIIDPEIAKTLLEGEPEEDEAITALAEDETPEPMGEEPPDDLDDTPSDDAIAKMLATTPTPVAAKKVPRATAAPVRAVQVVPETTHNNPIVATASHGPTLDLDDTGSTDTQEDETMAKSALAGCPDWSTLKRKAGKPPKDAWVIPLLDAATKEWKLTYTAAGTKGAKPLADVVTGKAAKPAKAAKVVSVAEEGEPVEKKKPGRPKAVATPVATSVAEAAAGGPQDLWNLFVANKAVLATIDEQIAALQEQKTATEAAMSEAKKAMKEFINS